MPFLRDEGPPVSQATIQRVREALPLEYGTQVLNETGREVLLVRVPKAKPDYLHDLADVAFYVTLDTIRNCKDVLLVGHEKTARLEPQLLRDHIRAQDREDNEMVPDMRRRLGRDYGATIMQSPSNHAHQSLAVRIPKTSIQDFSPDDVKQIRALVDQQRGRFEACQYAYVVADKDHERLGRRVLVELLGAPSPAPQPLPVAAEPPPVQPAAPRALSFPPTPGTVPAVAAAPSGGAGVLPSIFQPQTVATAPRPTPAAPEARPVARPEPALPPAPAAAAPLDITETEEYAIVSKPKAPPPEAAVQAPSAEAPSTTDVHEEYEIVSKPKAPAAAPTEAPVVEDHPDVERKVVHATEAYEVYTSKPKTPKPDTPSITPPGKAGFQAALQSSGPAPARTKEYEIMGGRPTPQAEGNVSRLFSHAAPVAPAAPPPPAPVVAPARTDDPRVVAAVPARAPAAVPVTQESDAASARRLGVVPNSDNGAPIVARVAPANPEAILQQRFKESGYEIVEGLRAQGTVFAFAAHKPNGRRVLVKRSAEFGADEAAQLAQLLAALGADVGLVVADKVAPGTRLATWGTRIEVCAPADVPNLAF